MRTPSPTGVQWRNMGAAPELRAEKHLGMLPCARGTVKGFLLQMTSSRLCKSVEGASFPFHVESPEDGVDDAAHGLHVDEADHGPGSSAYFHKAALDDVGGAQLFP